MHDPTIHDPTMHDSSINYPNMLTLYRDDMKGRKKISVIYKDLGSTVQKIFDKIVQKNYGTGVFL